MNKKKEELMGKLKTILGIEDSKINSLAELTEMINLRTENKEITSVVELKEALKVEYVSTKDYTKAIDEVKSLIEKAKGKLKPEVELKSVNYNRPQSTLDRIFNKINR